ncbi:MAG: twin-arginine translocation signal domain-containing protein, partial [Woeseiaceae bacterium]
MKTLNRRDFLRTSGAAALMAATPGITYAQVVGGPGPFTDYRALVCVFLFGGNDSYNMLVPNTAAEYAQYAA